MQSELLTITDFCKAANVGRTRAYQLINQGRIKALKLGRKTLIPRAAFEEFIAGLKPYTPGSYSDG